MKYKVVFEGGLLPGHNVSEVQPKLANLFGVSVESAAQLFSGKRCKVKGELDLKQANLYIRALIEHGAFAYIEEDQEPKEVPEITERLEPDSTVEEAKDPYEAYFEQQGDMHEDLQAELNRTGRYELMSEDELDEQLDVMNSDGHTLTGVMSIMTPEQLAKMRSAIIKNKS